MGQRSQPPHSSPSTHLAAGHRAGDVIWRPLSPTISHEDAATDCRRIRHPGRGVHRPAWTYLASTHPPTTTTRNWPVLRRSSRRLARTVSGRPSASVAGSSAGLLSSSSSLAWCPFCTHAADDRGMHQPLGTTRLMCTGSRVTSDLGANSARAGRKASIRQGESMNSRTKGSPVVESGNRLVRILPDEPNPSMPRQRVAPAIPSCRARSRITW